MARRSRSAFCFARFPRRFFPAMRQSVSRDLQQLCEKRRPTPFITRKFRARAETRAGNVLGFRAVGHTLYHIRPYAVEYRLYRSRKRAGSSCAAEIRACSSIVSGVPNRSPLRITGHGRQKLRGDFQANNSASDKLNPGRSAETSTSVSVNARSGRVSPVQISASRASGSLSQASFTPAAKYCFSLR
jgi:hypothetical protein